MTKTSKMSKMSKSKLTPFIIVDDDDDDEPETNNSNILLACSWKNTNSFKSIQDKETQIKYYKKIIVVKRFYN